MRAERDSPARDFMRTRRILFGLLAFVAFAIAAVPVYGVRNVALDEISGADPVVLIKWTYLLVPAAFILSRLLRRGWVMRVGLALVAAAWLCWLMLAPVLPEPALRGRMGLALAGAGAMGVITDLAVAAAQRWSAAFAVPYVTIGVETWVGMFLWIMWRYPDRVVLLKLIWGADALVAVAVAASVVFFLRGSS